MKNQLKMAIAVSLVALGFITSSCSDMDTHGTHEMGPPGKSRTMSDEEMQNKAR